MDQITGKRVLPSSRQRLGFGSGQTWTIWSEFYKHLKIPQRSQGGSGGDYLSAVFPIALVSLGALSKPWSSCSASQVCMALSAPGME